MATPAPSTTPPPGQEIDPAHRTRPRRPWVMVVWGVVAALIVVAGVWSAVDTGGGDSARSRLGVIAPAAPGGGWDLVARETQQALKSDGIVNNVQVVNIPGAAGTIGADQHHAAWPPTWLGGRQLGQSGLGDLDVVDRGV